MNITGDIRYLAAAIAVLGGTACAFGESKIVTKALEGMARNPEVAPDLRTSMILGCALDETTGIYALLIAILCLFIK